MSESWVKKLADKVVDGVYFDSVNGVAGTAWPIGTPSNPVNNITDAKLIAAARKTSTIILVHGVITLDADIAGYRFVGNGFSDPNEDYVENWIDLAGFTATECSFEYINIDFDAAGTLDKCGYFLRCTTITPDTLTNCFGFQDCDWIEVNTLTDCYYFSGCGLIRALTSMSDSNNFYNCGIISVSGPMDDCSNFLKCGRVVVNGTMTSCSNFYGCGYVFGDPIAACDYFYNCGFVRATSLTTSSTDFYDCGEADITYNCTLLNLNPVLSFRTGQLTISNLTGARTFAITGDGLRLIIDASCNAGTINIYGDVRVTDNSTGTTVNNYTGRGVVKTGTFTLLEGVAEQDYLIFAAAKQEINIELDMNALAQTNTVREKVQTNGADYRQISAKVFPTVFDTDTKVVILSFVQKGSLYKITLQASLTEGADKDIPYRYMVRDLS